MDSVLAFDPGVQATAMCCFTKGRIQSLILIPATAGHPRLFGIVDAVRRALPDVRPMATVIEYPEIYTSVRSWKGNPNNIRDLAAVAFAIATEVDYKYDHYPSLVLPRLWKGQVPKDCHHARILAGLTATQRRSVEAALAKVAPSLRHNLLDALGLALWRLSARVEK